MENYFKFLIRKIFKLENKTNHGKYKNLWHIFGYIGN